MLTKILSSVVVICLLISATLLTISTYTIDYIVEKVVFLCLHLKDLTFPALTKLLNDLEDLFEEQQ
jgi:hypothetical protein